jgi:DNA primase
VVPFFWNGELVYWTSRAYSGEARGPKYVAAPGRHPLYVLPALEPKPVVVEGVFDAMQVAMAGLPAIALGGKSLPPYLEPMMKQVVEHAEVYIMLDRDAVGDSVKLAERIDQFAVCTRILVPTAKDPGDMSPGDIRKLVLSRAA